MSPSTPALLLAVCSLALATASRAQFFDSFEGRTIDGWFHFTGDGAARMDFVPRDGFARIEIDASDDRHNVWWSIIKRDVTPFLDLGKLRDPAYALRVEARVRPSHAPRRVNFMLNTQRTTDFHEHLREYDLASTSDWHTISFTTDPFDAGPGDTVFVQLGVTDWGPDQYHLDVDYYRADVVRRDSAPPDLGEPLIYHAPVPPLDRFAHHLPATHDSVINADFPDVNFNDWHVVDSAGTTPVLTVTARQWPILRWDFERFRGQQVDGLGVLELTTHSVPKGGKYIDHYGEDLGIEFGKVRVIEILGGDAGWDQTTVTYRSLMQGATVADVFNSQMIYDVELSDQPGSTTTITLSRPVMQRLLDGRTKGLVLWPLGALTPSIYATEAEGDRGPTLHFNTKR
jgi:hypothetical protein